MKLLVFVLTFIFLQTVSTEWIPVTNHNLTKKTFTIALTQNPKGITLLENIIANISDIESPQYGKYLTPSQIDALIATPKYIKDGVLKWLYKNKIYDCHSHTDSIKCTANIDTIDKVFKTKTHFYQNIHTKKIKVTSTKPYKLPKNIEGIEFIDGISNKLYSEQKTKKNMVSDINVDSGAVTREVIMRMYNLYPNYITSNVSVGVIEFSGANGFSKTDLTISENWNGVETNQVNPNCLLGQMSQTDTESQLDVQTMYWGIPNGELCFEIVDTWLYSWSTDFANRKHIPEVVSLSWGWSETDQCSITLCNNVTSKQYIDRCNVEFMKIVARGTTIVVASGDAGSPGRTNEECSSKQSPNGWNHINAIFPGGSPWVLSVGATFLVQNNGSFAYQTPICKNMTCATGTEEQGVSFDRTGWTSGGGFDHWAQMPTWQKSLVQKYIKSGIPLPNQKYWNSKTRGYPDLCAIGHNCLIYDQDWENVDGTSCSSPIIAGLIANINSYQKSKGKPTLGFVNPLLYKMYTELPSTFNDILIGNSACTEAMCCGTDFGFKATKGWDPVSGLGSPNINEIKKYLDQY